MREEEFYRRMHKEMLFFVFYNSVSIFTLSILTANGPDILIMLTLVVYFILIWITLTMIDYTYDELKVKIIQR